MIWEDYPIFDDETFGILRSELFDVITALSPAEAEIKSVMERVCQFPLTASIFLQLLRNNEASVAKNNLSEALLAESLAYSTLQGSREFRQWLLSRAVNKNMAEELHNEPVVLRRENNTLFIGLNRPHARNAYSAAMRDALYEALQLLGADDSIAKCIIQGEGDCFCVGGDLNEFGLAADPALAHIIRCARSVPYLLMQQSHRIECHVHRACIGSGIELPAFASTLVATPDTFFQLPELTMGLIPGAGGTVSILRRIGRYRLAWWVLSGKRINAQTALTWGLVDRID